MRTICLTLVLIIASVADGAAQMSYSAADLEGAWIRLEGINPQGVATPSLPSIRTFVNGYYSWVQAPANRPNVDSTSTAAQLRAVWGTVTANSGRYEVVGNTMTQRTTVDRVPANMSDDVFVTFAIRLAADTMWITQIANRTGPLTNQGTGKYVRVR
jgi:hypothetical protein